MSKRILSGTILILLSLSMLTFTFQNQLAEAHQFIYPSNWWFDDFSNGMTGWNLQTGGTGSVSLSNTVYYTASYSIHVKSLGASYAYARPPANGPTPGSNAILSQLNYSQNYVVDFYFYLPSSNNHWIHVFSNKHINSVIDTGTTFTTRSGGVNTPVINLNITTWYRIRYWVEPANGTYHIDVYNCLLRKWVVWQVTRNFHGGPWYQDPFLIGDPDPSNPSSNWGEAYWDNFCIYFSAIPVKVVFRLLAVEGFYGAGNGLDESGGQVAGDFPMKSAQYLIQNLIQYTNWQNVTWGAFNYTSYIHLLSNATVSPALQKYYRGTPTNANVVSEIQNFLGQTGPDESNEMTIRIFYYVGHAGPDPKPGKVPLYHYLCLGVKGCHPSGPSAYEELYDFQLNNTLCSGDLASSSCVLIILDCCYSQAFIGSLKRPGRVVLASAGSCQLSWGWASTPLPGYWSWFTGDPNPAFPIAPHWRGLPVGLRGALSAKVDINKDGWASAGDIFKFANWSTPVYAFNSSVAMNVNPIIQIPKWYYGVRGGEIPIAMLSPWKLKPGVWPPQIVATGFPYNALPVLEPKIDLSSLWNNYRSDRSRTGYSLASGPITDQILWEKFLVNPIYSSAAVAEGMVFITTLGGGGGGGGGCIYALDIVTGEVFWSFSTDSPISSSPAVAEGTVYFGTDSGNVYAVEAYTGLVRYVYHVSTASIMSSPTVADGMVFLGSSDGNVYALNQSIGVPVWSFSTGSPVISSPAVADGRVFCGSENGIMYAINETTGLQVWYYPSGAPIVSTPGVADGMVFFSSKDTRLYALSETTGLPIWDFPTVGPVLSSPAVDSYKSLVVVGSSDGNVYAVNRTTGLPVWAAPTGSINMSSPAISSNGLVYIGTFDGLIYCLNETTGAEVWSFAPGGFIDSSPSISDGHMCIGTYDGIIFCFGPEFPVRNVAVTDLTVSPVTMYAGGLVEINCTAINKGNIAETFNVTIAYNTTQVWTPPLYNETIAIHTEAVTLASQESITITFIWNTSGFAKGSYTISAYAESVPSETETGDNTFFGDLVQITKVGDLGGGLPPQFFKCDGKVDGIDLALFIACYKGLAPPEAMQLADLGGGLPPQFFKCDGKVDGIDLALFIACYKGLGPPDP